MVESGFEMMSPRDEVYCATYREDPSTLLAGKPASLNVAVRESIPVLKLCKCQSFNYRSFQ